MIPVLNAAQLRAVDEATIERTPIASIDLMERAASRCTEWLLGRYGPTHGFLVLAGMGNNGGDGLAIGRQLHAAGRRVRMLVLQHRSQGSAEFEVERERARAAGLEVSVTAEAQAMRPPGPQDVVVDALLGTGLTRPLEGLLAQVAGEMASWRSAVVAIDLPTGLMADGAPRSEQAAMVRAGHTLTFELPKLAMLLPEHAPFLGQVTVLPIGLSRPAILEQATRMHVLEASDAARCLPVRPRFGHKGTFGHALLLAGGPGRIGAALLAAEAAVASGAGLITLRLPAGNEQVVHARLPSAMIDPDPAGPVLSTFPDLAPYRSIGIGPGIGTGDDTGRLLKRLIQEASVPLVLDADAINLLALNTTWLAFLPGASILTPHPKEFDRLAGPSSTGHDRLQKAIDLAQRRGVIIVLKGANTAICTPSGNVFFNPTGNVGMAKGGSGDALTGILTGLLAQGLRPEQAAVLGVFAHGLAGDLAAAELGEQGMTAADLVRQLPKAWAYLQALA